MKLVLKNFRCYTDSTFEFEDDDMTLISGPSGQGKTTILMAIQFVLFGSSNLKHLVTHGKTSCEVELNYKEWVVKRTKRPNILTVRRDDQFYEDDEGQVVLNMWFGSVSKQSFVDMSQTEKMQHFEKIAGGEFDIDELKTKIKKQVWAVSKDLDALDAQLLTASAMLEVVENPKVVIAPIGDEFEEESVTIEDVEKKLTSTQEASRSLYGITEKKSVITKELTLLLTEDPGLLDFDRESVRAKKDKLTRLKSEEAAEELRTRRLDDAVKDLARLEETLAECDTIVDPSDLDNLRSQLNECEYLCTAAETRLSEYNEFVAYRKYARLLEAEQSEWESQKVVCTRDVIDAECALNELCVAGEDTERVEMEWQRRQFAHLEAVSVIQSDRVEDLKDELNAARADCLKTVCCTACGESIVLNVNTLEIEQTDSEVKFKDTSNFASHREKIKKLEHKLRLASNLLSDAELGEIARSLDVAANFRKKCALLSKYKNFIPSTSLRKLVRPYRDEVASVTYVDVCKLKDDKREVERKIDALLVSISKHKSVEKRINALRCEIQALRNINSPEPNRVKKMMRSLRHLEARAVNFERASRLKAELNSLEDSAALLTASADEESGLIKKLHFLRQRKAYQVYVEKASLYQQAVSQLNTLKESKTVKEKYYLNLLLFKQKVSESETESLGCIIDTVNTHLQMLLDSFFAYGAGEPVEVYLEASSDKINIIVTHKGNMVDLKALSAGEYARIKLAFDLATSEISGQKILMLDECTANLEQGLSTHIYKRIKTSFPRKTILVVAHQIVTGPFDHMLQV